MPVLSRGRPWLPGCSKAVGRGSASRLPKAPTLLQGQGQGPAEWSVRVRRPNARLRPRASRLRATYWQTMRPLAVHCLVMCPRRRPRAGAPTKWLTNRRLARWPVPVLKPAAGLESGRRQVHRRDSASPTRMNWPDRQGRQGFPKPRNQRWIRCRPPTSPAPARQPWTMDLPRPRTSSPKVLGWSACSWG